MICWRANSTCCSANTRFAPRRCTPTRATGCATPADWDKQDAQYKQQIADKQKALDDAKQKLDDMQEDARKAGVPSLGQRAGITILYRQFERRG